MSNSRIRLFYEFGPFRLDQTERQLIREGKPLQLTPKVFDTLLVLVERHGHLVEKDEMIRLVWSDAFVEEANLARAVHTLRKVLGEEHNKHSYIETVPTRGYRFIAEVKKVSEDDVVDSFQDTPQVRLDTEGGNGDGSQNGSQPKPTFTRSWLRVTVFIAISGILVAAAILTRRTITQKTSIKSIAVIPFMNASNDPEMEYLSESLSENLINSLSQLPTLKVAAKNSSFKFKGKEVDLRKAAHSLGVEAILTGKILRRGDDFLISSELMDARDGRHVWGDHYTRKVSVSDLLEVQAEISREITEALRLRLNPSEQQQLNKRENVNLQAYELFLWGRHFWSKGGTENRKRAIEHLQQAIAVDPAYAPAWAMLSISYNALVNENVLHPEEFKTKARDAARTALLLDGGLAEAHLAMSIVRSYAWDWAAAEQEFKRAIELNPNLAAAHSGYTLHLIILGRHEHALVEAKRARELDPLSVGANAVVVYVLLLARQTDQAVEAVNKMLELNPNNPNVHALLGQIHTWNGQHPKAIAAWQEAISLGDDSPDAQIFLGAAYARLGEIKKTRAILRRLENGRGYVSPVGLAMLHVALGEREQAFALLQRAYAAHDQQLIWLGVESGFDPLRSEARFSELLQRIGIGGSGD